MKIRQIIHSLAAVLLLAACSADDRELPADGLVPVQLTASQEATVTRAADGLYTAATGFSGGEEVMVYLNGHNAIYTVGAADATTHTSAVTLKSGETQLCYPTAVTGTTPLYAVYPASSIASHTVAYDQSTDANYKASDLMFASATVSLADKANAQNLAFGHQLVKLKVIINKAAGVTSVTKVEMQNVKRTVSVTPASGGLTLGTPATATSDGNGDNIKIFDGTQTAAAATYACVFPVQAWSDANFLAVTADNRTLYVKLTKSDWTVGCVYQLTINVNAAVLNSTLTVSDWTDGTSAEAIPVGIDVQTGITPSTPNDPDNQELIL